MSLSTGLEIARSSLSINSDRASVVARNIASAGDPNATRKAIHMEAVSGGGVRVATISRDFDQGLFRLVQSSTSDNALHAAIVEGLNTIQQVVGAPDDEVSPAAMLARLRDGLVRYAAAPHEIGSGASAIASARNVAQSLNDANDIIQRVRLQADENIRGGVDRLSTLLSEFHQVNNEIVVGTRASRDVTDHEDVRANILAQMSELINVRTLQRSDNDMVILTDGGLVLFEGRPRDVAFDPTRAFDANVSGSAIYVDGMPITGASATQSTHSGRLVGLAKVRDELAVTAQSQLDEIARGLITLFAESDQTGGTAATVPGLFTYDGAPAMPAVGIVGAGLAGSISVNSSVDPSQGGDVRLLRDGAISEPGNAAYVYNAEGAAGYNERLRELADAFDETVAFDNTTRLSPSANLISFSIESVSWVDEMRRSATSDEARSAAVLSRASISMSKATGVNLDEEMTMMLDIERSYQASARLMSTIDTMFDALIAATR